MNEHTIAALVQAANNLLEAGEPGNISVDTYSGFTGYKPQFIIDAMNEAVGYGNWGFEEVSNEIVGDEKATLIVSQVRVFLKDCAFQPTGWGQARITKGDIGDAKKGALLLLDRKSRLPGSTERGEPGQSEWQQVAYCQVSDYCQKDATTRATDGASSL